jgi:hypothetical protein
MPIEPELLKAVRQATQTNRVFSADYFQKQNELPRRKRQGISKEFIRIAVSCGESDPHRIEVLLQYA